MVDTALAPAGAWLGPLGISGFSAYVGLLGVGLPSPGETLLVSSAAGAVGSVAAQIGGIKGCHVVGIAGGPGKCDFVEQTLAVPTCIDHRAPGLGARIGEVVPDGVNVYFDNVGGRVRDAVWPHLARSGRVVVCGQISQYGSTTEAPGPGWDLVLTRALRIEGLDFSLHRHRYDEFIVDMAGWIRSGQVVTVEHRETGLDSVPSAFVGMLEGRFRGKVVVEL